MTCIADSNLSRSEALGILGISYAVEECKLIHAELQKLEDKVSTEEYLGVFGKEALRLDFTITYYQLNCILLESFSDPDCFSRVSKVELIV